MTTEFAWRYQFFKKPKQLFGMVFKRTGGRKT